jgi:hypothetical protein
LGTETARLQESIPVEGGGTSILRERSDGMTTDVSIGFSDVLGRRVRLGRWEDQKVSTYRVIEQALQAGDGLTAADHAHYFTDEANVCFSLYRQWIRDLRGFLARQGVPADEVAAIDAEVVSKLDLPDGSSFDPFRHWDAVGAAQRQLIAACHRGDTQAGLQALAEMKELWRQTHDRDVDHTYGLMSAIQERFGADGIAAMYQDLLVPLFAWRYQKFDVDKYPWDEGLEVLMLVACEAMRGHLVGPERTGDFELVELEDRYVLRFDPCGSGGRTLRGDAIEGTPARMEPPYSWEVAKEPASWNHFTPGVCLYCAHCVVLMEEIPMDRFGYPVRTVTPPIYGETEPDGGPKKCTWEMFKDPTAVPEEYYERVGRTKPAVFGSTNFDQSDLPDASALGLPGAG